MAQGSLVAAAVVARWLGLDARTVRSLIERGAVRGTCLGGKWYVSRTDAETLRDAPDAFVPPNAE